jgi:hypothetical protein
MARRTTAERIEQDNQQAALAFFERMLAALPDPRRRQGQRYPLRTVVVTALMAMVCGCDDAEAMQAWAEANEAWLATMLEMPHGAPSQDVFLAVLGALDPQALQAVLRGWAQMLAARLKGRGRHIAVDGKTSRRSSDPVIFTPPTCCGGGSRRRSGVAPPRRTAKQYAFVVAPCSALVSTPSRRPWAQR